MKWEHLLQTNRALADDLSRQAADLNIEPATLFMLCCGLELPKRQPPAGVLRTKTEPHPKSYLVDNPGGNQGEVSKFRAGGAARRGPFADIDLHDLSPWTHDPQRALLDIAKGWVESDAWIKIGKGHSKNAFADYSTNKVYLVGFTSEIEIRKSVAAWRLGIGPKIYLDESLYFPHISLEGSASAEPSMSSTGVGVIAMERLTGPVLRDALDMVTNASERHRLIFEYGKLLAKVHVLMKTQHGDFHAANVVLDASGANLKVIDFGRASGVGAEIIPPYIGDIFKAINDVVHLRSSRLISLGTIDVTREFLGGYQQGLDEAEHQKGPWGITFAEKQAIKRAIEQAIKRTLRY